MKKLSKTAIFEAPYRLVPWKNYFGLKIFKIIQQIQKFCLEVAETISRWKNVENRKIKFFYQEFSLATFNPQKWIFRMISKRFCPGNVFHTTNSLCSTSAFRFVFFKNFYFSIVKQVTNKQNNKNHILPEKLIFIIF